MKTYSGEYNHKDETIKIGKKLYRVISVTHTEIRYPGIFKAGTVRIFNVKIGDLIHTINEYKSGLFGGAKKVYGQ